MNYNLISHIMVKRKPSEHEFLATVLLLSLIKSAWPRIKPPQVLAKPSKSLVKPFKMLVKPIQLLVSPGKAMEKVIITPKHLDLAENPNPRHRF